MNGNLLAVPSNTAAVVHESNATLSCKTTSTTPLLTWQHNSVVIVINGIDQYPGNFSASQSNGTSILTINTEVTNAQTGGSAAGTYQCLDPSAAAPPFSWTAQLILLGTNSHLSFYLINLMSLFIPLFKFS